ncbi:MAG: hypothetical protein EBX40_07925, partial [Gammaproteobacteria bacterium]|nr:hypothetical protein [Gammaproteobacteria bacterium]
GSTTCNGRNCPTTAQYASIWAQIAKHFANNPNVMFELMNEPQGLSPEKTLALENAAIAKIRSAETVPHTIVLDGAFWSGLHSWVDDTEHPGYSTNAAVFTESNIKDPANQYILDVHQYFDPDSSGRYTSACTDAATLEANMHFGDFKTWAEAHHMRVILGEFGAHYDFTDPSDPTHHLNDVENCRADFSTVLNDVASFASPEPLKAGSAGFVGWTVWSAGHAWGDYLMNISPDGPANSWMSDPQVFANPALLNPVADLPPFGEKIAEICNHTTENIPFSSNFGPFESTEGGGLNAMSNGEMSCDSIDSPKASGEESPSYAGGSGSHADHYAELTYGSYLDGQYAGIGLTNEGSAYSWGSLENGTLQIQPEPDNACPTLGATDLPNRCYWFVKN